MSPSEAPLPPARARLADLWSRLRQGGVLRSIGVLVGGSAAAHGVTAAIMPISTRLYTPTDFAAASVFASLVGIIVAAACLRFDVAIALPADDEEAANLLGLSALSSVGVAALAALALAVLPPSTLALLGQPAVLPLLWLLPPTLLIGGLYLALQTWYVRSRQFGPIARSRLGQSVAAAGGQIGLGLAGQAPLGLIVGQMLNYGAGSLTLGAGALWRQRWILSRISWRGMGRAFVTHRRFPQFSVWEALANAASIHAPLLLIAALAEGPEAGYLTLAIFLLQAPMALVGNAVGQVYLSGAPDAHRRGDLASYTRRMAAGLFKTAAVPIALIAIVSPFAFEMVFGEGWGRAGVLVAWMAPWFLLQFVTSPVSTALHVVGAQRTAMLLQVGGLCLRCGAVLIGELWMPRLMSELYAVSGAFLYAAYLVTIMVVVGGRSPRASSS